MPFVVGALGKVTNGLDQNSQLLPAHRSASELQKVTLMTTAHSFRYLIEENKFKIKK